MATDSQKVAEVAAQPFIRTKFPLLGADVSGDGLLLLGGGGGSSKTGVPNSIMLCSLASSGIAQRGIHPTGDEAVTSLSVDTSGRYVACVQSNSVVVRSPSVHAASPSRCDVRHACPYVHPATRRRRCTPSPPRVRRQKALHC